MCYDIEVMIMAKIIGIQTYYRKRFFFQKNTSDFLDHSFWFVHSEHFLVQKWDIKVDLESIRYFDTTTGYCCRYAALFIKNKNRLKNISVL